MSWREPLLTIHILSVIVWLGCGLYEIFVASELKRVRGTKYEIDLARFYLKYSAPVPIATILVAITGATMAIVLEYGFFQVFWLGVKQGLMVVVLIIFAAVIPPFVRLGKVINETPEGAEQLPEEAGEIFDKVEPWVLAMRVLGAVAVVFAVFKFAW